jgi:hypothetical protein
MTPTKGLLGLAAACLLCGTANAEISGNVVRVGVLNDISGIFQDTNGMGSVEAARMAAEDFAGGGKNLKVEIVYADHQNKADVGNAIARRWLDNEGSTDAKLAQEPVSIYISRSTQKLYVRRNTRKPLPDGGELFDFSIEVPVTIRDPERPIGTHIFTAMARNDAGLRWSAVTIESADDAKSALDRVTIPPEVLERIGPTALPRSSIIISDEPLSAETNYRTEFVAVLSDQPQGGFITRKPTSSDVPVASSDDWNDGGFGFFFQPREQRVPEQSRRGRYGEGYYRQPQDYYRQEQPGWW